MHTADEGRSVSVYCNDRSHPTRRAKLEVFIQGEGGTWASMPQTMGRRERMMSERPWELQRTATTHLTEHDVPIDPDAPVFGDEGSEPAMSRAGRVRFAIKCPICGLSLAAREETLEPILDELANREVDAVPLRWLAARITSK